MTRTREPQPVTVFCADDHPVFRAIVRKVIRSTPGFRLVGEAASGEDAISAVPELAPDLVLMDVHMPGIGGLAAARVLLKRQPGLTVVLISAQELPSDSGIGTGGPGVVFLRKEHLCPSMLLDIWRDRRPTHGSNWVLVRLGDAFTAE